MFQRYIGIDYSGAGKPTDGRAGLRVYQAKRGEGDQPEEVPSPNTSRSKLWSREGIAKWLVEELRKPEPTLVGIDHGFSFPGQYFENYELKPDWSTFLGDFRDHWPTHKHAVRDVRSGKKGRGEVRRGSKDWFRLTERLAEGAKSVFQFDVPGQVAPSTHAGLPWLLHVREELESSLHFWPFDGWDIPAGRSAVAEVYPALWNRHVRGAEYLTNDQRDALCVASWLRWADQSGCLRCFLRPSLDELERERANREGWILGVQGFLP